MKHEIKARYPAPAAVVIKMMTDKKFYTDRLEKLGHAQYEVLEHKSDGGNFSLKIKRPMPIQAPGVLKKFIPGNPTIVHVDAWNAKTLTGTVLVELPGIPVEISATTALKDQGSECVLTYVFDIRSKVPLLGGTIEKATAAENDKEIPLQTKAGVELLKNYR